MPLVLIAGGFKSIPLSYVSMNSKSYFVMFFLVFLSQFGASTRYMSDDFRTYPAEPAQMGICCFISAKFDGICS